VVLIRSLFWGGAIPQQSLNQKTLNAKLNETAAIWQMVFSSFCSIQYLLYWPEMPLLGFLSLSEGCDSTPVLIRGEFRSAVTSDLHCLTTAAHEYSSCCLFACYLSLFPDT